MSIAPDVRGGASGPGPRGRNRPGAAVRTRRGERDVLVLGYHALSTTWEDPLAVVPAALHAQVAGLLRRGYVATTFTRAVLDPPASRTLAVTFDDACASVATRAWPVLAALGAPATVFAPSGWVGRPEPMRWDGIEQHADGPDRDELRCLDWTELRALQEDGWEVGSHTVDHPRLTALDDDAVAGQLTDSRAALEAGLGTAIRSVAYPYGAVDARVAAQAARAGYAAGAGLPATPHRPRALDWPRVGVYRRDDARRFRVKSAPGVRRVRRALGR